MHDPAPHSLVEGAAAESALPPADRVFLFALLPQVVSSSLVLGLSAWRMFPVYSSWGLNLPTATALFHGLASPIVSFIFGLVGVALGAATLLIPISPHWKSRSLHSLGVTYLGTLVVWMVAAGKPMEHIMYWIGSSMDPSPPHYTWTALLPFLLPVVALLRSGGTGVGRVVPYSAFVQILMFLAALEFGTYYSNPAEGLDVEQYYGPFSWDLALIGYGACGTLAGSIVANAILGWLLYALPNQRARWDPGFALAMSVATIIVCSRKLGYWCAAF